MGRLIDLHGMKFHRLTVTGRAENNQHKRAQWFCLCTCGNETIVESWCLRSGNTKSCGCLHSEQLKAHTQKCWKHGYARRGNQRPQYRAWTRARTAGKTQLDFSEFLNQQKKSSEPVQFVNTLAQV